MQALIPLIATLSVVSGVQLNLWPYAYLSNPLPVYNQYQNTRTGEHAYSYAGGPSAKQEIKGADGVTRGSYSYVDANGIVQSVFYVADENGFRVAATDLPSDNNLNLETPHIVLARSAKAEETVKSSRSKRSLEEPSQSQQKEKNEAADAVLLKGLPPVPTSYQGQVQIHKDVQLEPAKPLLQIADYQPFLVDGEIPLATSHQSRIQVNRNARINLFQLSGKFKPIDVDRLPSIIALPNLVEQYSPPYYQHRVVLAKPVFRLNEGEQKDAIKIDPLPLNVVKLPPDAPPAIGTALPPIPVAFAKEDVSVAPAEQLGTASVSTSITSHGISQIHPSTILKESVALPSLIAGGLGQYPVLEKTDPAAPAVSLHPAFQVVQPDPTVLIHDTVPLIPLVHKDTDIGLATVSTSISSHGVSQIHGNSKI